MLLKGKNILITGASRGIGKAILEKFASEGASGIFICARNPELLGKIKEECESRYATRIYPLICDVASQDSINDMFNAIHQSGVVLDVLVNNAGVMQDAALMMASRELYDNNFSVNVAGTIFVTQKALRHFIRKRKGSIINLASIVGIYGVAGQSIYAASKAAIVGFTKSLSKELAGLHIKVNAIAPGFIDTDMTASFNQEQKEKIISAIGFKKPGSPEDVANTALFLASDLSDFTTGQVIGVDGGQTL